MVEQRKICHLSSVHSKGDVRILQKECTALAAAGYDVSFVVPADADERVKGVRVVALKRAGSRLQRMAIMPWRVLWAGLRQEAFAYHFHDPELIPVGCLLKLLGRRVVYDVHEDVPADILMKAYLPVRYRKLIAAGANIVEKSAARLFDRIVTATPAIARRFPASKTQVVQNFPILGELSRQDATPYEERPPYVAYVGMITRERGALEMVKAMALVEARYDARLQMAGSFSDDALARGAAAEDGWAAVDYQGLVGRDGVAAMFGKARAGLVLFHPGPNHDEAQPNKLFEYMSAGLPLIASDFPLWRELIERERCGLVVSPKDPDAIARAITWILEHPAEARAMGERGKIATETVYNWRKESKKLVDLYDQLGGLRRADER